MSQSQQLPDFSKMTFKCACCDQERMDKFIRVITHDIGHLLDQSPGSLFFNVKYCVDVLSCKNKALDRGWVITSLLPERLRRNQKNAV